MKKNGLIILLAILSLKSYAAIDYTSEEDRLLVNYTEGHFHHYQEFARLIKAYDLDIPHACKDEDIFTSPPTPKTCRIAFKIGNLADLAQRSFNKDSRLLYRSFKIVNNQLSKALKDQLSNIEQEKLLVERARYSSGAGGCGAGSGSGCGSFYLHRFVRAVKIKTLLGGQVYCTTKDYSRLSQTQGCFFNAYDHEDLSDFEQENIHSFYVSGLVDNNPRYVKSSPFNLYQLSVCQEKPLSEKLDFKLSAGESFFVQIKASMYILPGTSSQIPAAKINEVHISKKTARQSMRSLDSRLAFRLKITDSFLLGRDPNASQIECEQMAPQGLYESILIKCTNRSSHNVALTSQNASAIHMQLRECNTPE